MNESRPGISSVVLRAEDAIQRVSMVVRRNESIRVVGVAGPGEPLVNEETLRAMRLIQRMVPGLILCLSTNGLLLEERLEEIVDSGVQSITVTINALSPEVAERIYAWVRYRGRLYTGMDAARLLLGNQWRGLKKAVERGLVVKVNTVLIPGINTGEIAGIARLAGEIGAEVMNIIPLIPQGELSRIRAPSASELSEMRRLCARYIRQIRHCQQCRADALGLIGEERDIELEGVLAVIGEGYMEDVH